MLHTIAYQNYLRGFMTAERISKIHTVLAQRTQHFTVCIEDIYQLHNTSAVLRTCEVFGIQSLHVVDEKYGKNIDTEIAMGAQKWVDVYRHNHTQELITILRKKNYRIIATTPHAKDATLQHFSIDEKAAFFFGTERLGLSETVLSQADGFIYIPMCGFTESLNISVSAAIILQQLTEKLRQSAVKWQMTDEELFEKSILWYENSIKNIVSIRKSYLARL